MSRFFVQKNVRKMQSIAAMPPTTATEAATAVTVLAGKPKMFDVFCKCASINNSLGIERFQ